MESLLLVVAVVSVLVAAGMSLVAWRSVRDERRRAAARVAALSAAASAEAVEAEVEIPRATATWGAASRARASRVPVPSAAREVIDVPFHPGFLGAQPVVVEHSRQRGLAAAAAIVALGLMTFVGVRYWDSTAATPVVTAASPLELLSLRHEREGNRLSVAGLVRNPATGHVVQGLSAVVFLFDQQGAFVTSGRAPVDFVKIGAGDETPFVVKLDAPQAVARYRVSFRADDHTLPHVDLRGEPPLTAPVSLAK